MKTERLAGDVDGIERGATLLREGGVIAFPTETVYGLGAVITCDTAIDRIFAVKGRPSDNPLIAHISDLSMLDRLVPEIPEAFYRLAAQLLPGPLAIVLPCLPTLSRRATAGHSTIAIRMPGHTIARSLIASVGAPLVAPSANLSGRPSSTTSLHVLDDFDGAIDAVIEGGACRIGIESTVITLEGDRPTILRPGGISCETLESVLQTRVDIGYGHPSAAPKAPGMKYRHYAPKASVRWVGSFDEAERQHRLMPRSRVIVPQLASLYADLRAADSDAIEVILMVVDETVACNDALLNRLAKMEPIVS